MISTVRVVLEGLPEHVQEVADALDKAWPDTFDWHDFALFSGEATIVLKGSAYREFRFFGLLDGRPPGHSD